MDVKWIDEADTLNSTQFAELKRQINELEVPGPPPGEKDAGLPTREDYVKSYQKDVDNFNQTHLCNELERLLWRGRIRQAQRRFERLFSRHWPEIHPDAKRHPRLTIVVAEYKRRIEAEESEK